MFGKYKALIEEFITTKKSCTLIGPGTSTNFFVLIGPTRDKMLDYWGV